MVWYQKKHSPTHTHPDHQTSFINFLHLQWSVTSSLFNLRAWQFFSTSYLWSASWSGTSYSIHFYPNIIFLHHMPIPSQPVLLQYQDYVIYSFASTYEHDFSVQWMAVIKCWAVSVYVASCVKCLCRCENAICISAVTPTLKLDVSLSVRASFCGFSVPRSYLRACSVSHRCCLSSAPHVTSHSLPRPSRDSQTSPGITVHCLSSLLADTAAAQQDMYSASVSSLFIYFLTIPVRSLISKSSRPIFTKLPSELVEL